MPFIILMAVMGLPILEIIGFIQVGGWIGLGPTLGLVFLAALLGLFVLRAQGLATLMHAQASLARGEAPIKEVFDGACLMVAGILLLIPGFFTDLVGFLLLTPPVRAFLRARLGTVTMTTASREAHSATIIEGEFKDLTKLRDKDV